mmetsp:Transcript_4799/g.9041  ORF Transcript_4799/g.9041 Transcript_4799/m.9041 type:complete len:193 (+) Transcript_4799:73-651(+)
MSCRWSSQVVSCTATYARVSRPPPCVSLQLLRSVSSCTSSGSGNDNGEGKSGPLFKRIEESFQRQGMMVGMGAELSRVLPGSCEIRLPYSDKVTQQQGGFHGGAVGAIADIAAGYSSLTVAPEGREVTTVEYKINFLAACSGGYLRAEGRVVKAGKRAIITAADVFHQNEEGGKEVHCAIMQQTVMVVEKKY